MAIFQISHPSLLEQFGGKMEFFSALGNINWEVIAQLTMVALIMIAGPMVIFLLAAVRGDL